MSTGDSLLAIARVPWPAGYPRLIAIRKAVFVQEQGVPPELEEDATDPVAQHFLATIAGQAVATARLSPEGQIGRMAVLASHRGQGIGSALLCEVLRVANRQGLSHLFLHAQNSAVGFYRRHGFVTAGGTFVEAGIVHQLMERPGHARHSPPHATSRH